MRWWATVRSGVAVGLVAVLGVAGGRIPTAQAHPGTLTSVRLTASGVDGGVVRGTVQAVDLGAEGLVGVHLGGGCVPRSVVGEVGAEGRARRWQTWTCPDGLAGVPVTLSGTGPDGGPGALPAVVLVSADVGGTTHRALRGASQPRWTVPTPEADVPTDVLGAYLRQGVLHIAEGFDHLLFVAGLALLVGWSRRLLLTVTAFTVGHSLTLGVTFLGGPAPASAPTEALIALTLVWLAREVVLATRPAPTPTLPSQDRRRRGPWWAGLFGLIHGFGFAGALTDLGVPSGAVGWALLGFNLGVELGQLLFLAGLGAVAWTLVRILGDRRPPAAWWATLGGAVAMSWCIGRVLGLGGG